jgi:outer membrane protein assembly factor BamA
VNIRAADDRPITRISLVADAPFDTTALAAEVTMKPGQRVSVREVQSSMKNLFATGNFRDIRVDSAPADGGVVLTFSLYLHYRVGEVRSEGITGRDRTRAQRELTVRTGDILSLNDVDESAAAIEEALRQDGYLEATVDPETDFDRLRSIADVIFHVTPGPRASIAQVIIEGNLAPFTPAQLIEPMKRDAGRPFSLLEAREDAERIKNFLVRRDHRRANVDFLGHEYEPATHTVTLRYRVNVGPIVKVQVAGVDRRAVRKWIPFARNQEYSEDAIEKAADDIVRGLQQRGHFNATVDTESSLENNVWTTTFQVSPGPRYRLTGVNFGGNDQVPDKDLEKVVTTSPRGGWKRFLATLFRRPQGVTREQLSDDQEALESYYLLNGFSEAAVATPEVTTNDATGLLTVDFPITEGPQTRVTEVRVDGYRQVSAEELPQPRLRPGDPLNPQLVHEDVVALQTFYAERGNVEVQVSRRADVSADKTLASVLYQISEGPQVDVDEVTVRGNTYTDRDVVLRKADIKKGAPFTYTRLLEAQRDLYRLGIFNRVEIQPEQAGTTSGDRDVVIQVEEGKNLTLSGSVGLRMERGTQSSSGAETIPDPSPSEEAGSTDGTSPFNERVAIAAAHRNLFGTGRYLGLEAILGRQEQEFFLTYREPFISRWNVPVQLQVFQSDDKTRPGTRIRQRGLSIEASKIARLETRWSLRYEYKISECLGGPVCDLLNKNPEEPIEGLDPTLSNIQISSITPTFFWDRRDDILDPHRGFFTSASVEYAFPIFSAKAGFLKENIQAAYYLPLGRSVFVVAGRLGLIQPFAEKSEDELLEGELPGVLRPVPLSERFTAGGETMHRGFGLDRLGTLCQDPRDFYGNPPRCAPTLFRREGADGALGPILPLGGNGLLLLNAEYRFPIAGTLGGALFVDAGNVYASNTIRWDDLRYAVGAGIRYLSPVGPLRLDVGLPLQRRIIGMRRDGSLEYEESFQYFISIGYPF